MPPRFFCSDALHAGEGHLDDRAARHVRVLRLDAGDAITLFDGRGGEWSARIVQTRKDAVRVEVDAHHPVERELAIQVHLALGVPANERMDFLVEKATELGVASIQPLLTSRSVLRLSGERAAKKLLHWQAIALSACEQCGRNRVPTIHPMLNLEAWIAALAPAPGHEARVLLSPSAPVAPGPAAPTVLVLSGPEGGLSADEEGLAVDRQGFVRLSLGPRVLRADTAPLAALVALGYA